MFCQAKNGGLQTSYFEGSRGVTNHFHIALCSSAAVLVIRHSGVTSDNECLRPLGDLALAVKP
jgi:hypothetical protein